jgi:sugar O-acyltransferase (sialic acid O-acetyltransferase NeuD family)
MDKIVIYGAGGFGKEVACILNAINQKKPTWNLIGFFDDGKPIGLKNQFGTVIGGINELNARSEELALIISISDPSVLFQVVEKVTNPKIYFPNLSAPTAILLDKASLKIGMGNVIFLGCRVSCDVRIGNFNLMNSHASLGHDVEIMDYNIIGPSTRISGNTKVGSSNFFGVNSVVLQGLKIGNHTRIGAGSIVMRNTTDHYLYFGNPAKKTQF